MSFLRSLIAGLRTLTHSERTERELDEELRAFHDASVEEKMRRGMPEGAAERAARIEMGSRNAVKHHVRSAGWESWVENLWFDLRLSLRGLMRTPGFSLIAVLSLALGIGANAAIFTLVHQLLLRNLPVQNPNQLVTFGDATNSGVGTGVDLGQYGMFPWYFARQLEKNPGPFQGIAALSSFDPKVSVHIHQEADSTENSPTQLATAGLVSGNYFSVLGAHALMGRTITPADDAVPGSGAVAVISFHFWQNSLSSNPGILGKTITINGTPFDVIGVMPRGFEGIKQGLEPADLWTPMTMQTVIMQQPSMLTPGSTDVFMNIFARLSPEATANKRARMQSQTWINQQFHTMVRANEGGVLSPTRQREIDRENVPLIPAGHGVSDLQDSYGESLRVLMGVVALVLLIACANLANFLLARTAVRQREIITRLALGSSRARIARQSLIETILLSLAGGLFGLGIAFSATRILIAFVSQGNEWVGLSAAPDFTVLLFTLGLSVLTGILFGLAPAISSAQTETQGALSSSARSSGGAKRSRWWPKSLVVGQIVLSLLLLVTAGLFLRTLRNLENQNYGFDRTSLLIAEFDAKLAGYTPVQTADLHQRLLDRLSAIPGVQSAALALTPPISGGHWRFDISIPGYTPAPKENMGSILNRVSSHYFETAGIPIIAGRPIEPTDSLNSTKVVVVNQTLARRFFPKGDAIGHSLTIGIDDVKGPWRIVGIAGNTIAENPRNKDPQMMTYIPLAQIEPFVPAAGDAKPAERTENQDCFAKYILLRTHGDPSAEIAGLRAAVRAVDPNLPLLNISTIREEVSRMMGDDQLSSSLTAIFALLALVLAAIGLYGVMSYNVAQRTNEIGVRIALGATQGGVQWMVLRESLWLLGLGLVLGLPAALGAAEIIRSQLYEMSPFDPVILTVAVAVIAAVTVLAAWLPARRAARVDPVVSLRCE